VAMPGNMSDVAGQNYYNFLVSFHTVPLSPINQSIDRSIEINLYGASCTKRERRRLAINVKKKPLVFQSFLHI